jgi:hypothetical protein
MSSNLIRHLEAHGCGLLRGGRYQLIYQLRHPTRVRMRLLRQLHDDRYIELSQDEKTVQTLPPGSEYLQERIQQII